MAAANGYRLHVQDLPGDISERDLKLVFATYGDVRIERILNQKQEAGSAYLSYATRKAAQDAITVLNENYRIREGADRPIRVSWAGDQAKATLADEHGRHAQKDSRPDRSKDVLDSNGEFNGQSERRRPRPDSDAGSNEKSADHRNGGLPNKDRREDGRREDLRTDDVWRGGGRHESNRREDDQRKGRTNNGDCRDAERRTGDRREDRRACDRESDRRTDGRREEVRCDGSIRSDRASRSSDRELSRARSRRGFEHGRGNRGDSGGRKWNGGGSGKQDSQSGSRVYVGNLPGSVTEDDLEAVFRTFGNFLGLKIITTRSGSRKPCSAIIRYSSASEADAAIASLNDKYVMRGGDGPIRVKPAKANPRWEPY